MQFFKTNFSKDRQKPLKSMQYKQDFYKAWPTTYNSKYKFCGVKG